MTARLFSDWVGFCVLVISGLFVVVEQSTETIGVTGVFSFVVVL